MEGMNTILLNFILAMFVSMLLKTANCDEGMHNLRCKWTQDLKGWDHDNTGQITEADYTSTIMEVEKLIGENEFQKQACRNWLNNARLVWQNLLDPENTKTVDIDAAIANVEKSYKHGALPHFVNRFRTDLFDCGDVDENGRLTHDEFVEIEEATGPWTQAEINKAFQVIATISRQEYVDAYVAFLTDPNVTINELPLDGPPSDDCQ